MTCHYDPALNAFVALCKPILSGLNRNEMLENDPMCFGTTHDLDLRLLGTKGHLGVDLLDVSDNQVTLYQMVAPDCLHLVAKRHAESKICFPPFIFFIYIYCLVSFQRSIFRFFSFETQIVVYRFDPPDSERWYSCQLSNEYVAE